MLKIRLSLFDNAIVYQICDQPLNQIVSSVTGAPLEYIASNGVIIRSQDFPRCEHLDFHDTTKYVDIVLYFRGYMDSGNHKVSVIQFEDIYQRDSAYLVILSAIREWAHRGGFTKGTPIDCQFCDSIVF